MPLRSQKENMGLLILMLGIWTLIPIFVKYLNFGFAPFVQIFYRGLFATIEVVPFLSRREYRRVLSLFKIFLLPAAMNSISRICATWGIVLSQANTGAFLVQLAPIFVAPLAYLYIPREKSIVKKPLFIASFSLVLACVAFITLGRHQGSFSLGSILLVLSSLTWALYTIMVKAILDKTEVGIIPSVFVLLFLSTLFFFPFASIHIGQILHAPLLSVCILVISGVSSLAAARLIYHHLLKGVGAIVITSTLLSTPFITSIFAFLILGETITTGQLVAGAGVLGGCFLILRLGRGWGA